MLVHVSTHIGPRGLQVCLCQLREHHIHVVDRETGRTVGCGEDGVGAAEADVGLIHIIEHGLVDPEATGQGVDELGAESRGLDADENLHWATPHLGRQLSLLMQDCVGLVPQLRQVHVRERVGDGLDSLHVQLVAFAEGVRAKNDGVLPVVSPGDLAAQSADWHGLAGQDVQV